MPRRAAHKKSSSSQLSASSPPAMPKAVALDRLQSMRDHANAEIKRLERISFRCIPTVVAESVIFKMEKLEWQLHIDFKAAINDSRLLLRRTPSPYDPFFAVYSALWRCQLDVLAQLLRQFQQRLLPMAQEASRACRLVIDEHIRHLSALQWYENHQQIQNNDSGSSSNLLSTLLPRRGDRGYCHSVVKVTFPVVEYHLKTGEDWSLIRSSFGTELGAGLKSTEVECETFSLVDCVEQGADAFRPSFALLAVSSLLCGNRQQQRLPVDKDAASASTFLLPAFLWACISAHRPPPYLQHFGSGRLQPPLSPFFDRFPDDGSLSSPLELHQGPSSSRDAAALETVLKSQSNHIVDVQGRFVLCSTRTAGFVVFSCANAAEATSTASSVAQNIKVLREIPFLENGRWGSIFRQRLPKEALLNFPVLFADGAVSFIRGPCTVDLFEPLPHNPGAPSTSYTDLWPTPPQVESGPYSAPSEINGNIHDATSIGHCLATREEVDLLQSSSSSKRKVLHRLAVLVDSKILAVDLDNGVVLRTINVGPCISEFLLNQGGRQPPIGVRLDVHFNSLCSLERYPFHDLRFLVGVSCHHSGGGREEQSRVLKVVISDCNNSNASSSTACAMPNNAQDGATTAAVASTDSSTNDGTTIIVSESTTPCALKELVKGCTLAHWA